MLRREPDLVVTDVRLPDGTGHEVVKRAARLHSRPFIVAMSGKASSTEAFELARAPVRLYLEKPFSVNELAERIGAAFAIQRVDATDLAWREAVPEHVQGELLEQLRQIAIERALTPRETECVRLTLTGTPRGELPQALGVSPNTCKTLIRGVLRKCGTKRLAQVTTIILTRARWKSDLP
jgi:DNA-binding NarL/FixJ family response regulator